MDLDDVLRDDISKDDSLKEIEDERSNGIRSVYIDRKLIFSDRFIDAIKSLGENRVCTKSIVDSARKMLEHHHGDKYEDLYFVDAISGKTLARTDYREKEQEVLPTKSMKAMAKNNPNIVCLHNHPTNALPSLADIKTCFLVDYKYGLVFCHGGNIFQYSTLDAINPVSYQTECAIYYKKEQFLTEVFGQGDLTRAEFEDEHRKNFSLLSSHLLDAGVILKEVLWNGKPCKQYQ